MEKFFKVYTIDFYIGTIVKRGVENQIDYTDTISVTYPLTAQFAIGRSVSSFMNTAQVVIFGLDETKRNILKKDRTIDITKYIKMVIHAGYGEASSTIYQGSIQECYSVRQGGETEWKTIIDSTDATIDLYSAEVRKTFAKDSDKETIISGISAELSELKLGIISPYIDIPKPKRAITFDGKVLDVLRDLQEGTVVIDNGMINVLDLRKDIIGALGTLHVNCDTGLLGTPRRRNLYLSCDIIFEPQASLCQYCELESAYDESLNAGYKIMGVSHNGIISGTKDGALTTTIDLYFQTEPFRIV